MRQIKANSRRLRAYRICASVGVAAAFLVVLLWFPHTRDMWTYPIQQIDAPAHYYFIRRILDEGASAALHLWPNDTYYPPLFHLLAAGLIKLSALFGIQISVVAAFNVVWIAISGIVWPFGCQLLASYWTRGRLVAPSRMLNRFARFNGKAPKYGAEQTESDMETATAPTVQRSNSVFACIMAILIPLLAVSSPSHPYWMLNAGPLIAFGMASSLLPIWLYVSLRLLDVIQQLHSVRNLQKKTADGRVTAGYFSTNAERSSADADFADAVLVQANVDLAELSLLKIDCRKLIIANVLMMALCIFAHPRIDFTWLLFIAPFILVKLHKKYILVMLGVCVLGAVALFGYMVTHSQYTTLLNPSKWFHTFTPTRTIPQSIGVLLTGNIAGIAGCAVAILAVSACSVAVVAPRMLRKRMQNQDRVAQEDTSQQFSMQHYQYVLHESIAMVLLFVVVATVYICSASVTGWFANIVTAVWYRGETRTIAMLPLLYVMLSSYACSVAWYIAGLYANNLQTENSQTKTSVQQLQRMRRALQTVPIALLCIVVVLCQASNPLRADLRHALIENTSLHNPNPHEQMTEQKYRVLEDISHRVGPDDVVISDPLNGSMYGMAAFGTNMLYPIYNPKAEHHGAIFGQVEQAFDSTNPQQVEHTVCPISPQGDEYFLTMGGQAPSLQMFTFKEQYDPFHNERTIDQYVVDGVLQPVEDYSNLAPRGEHWELYKFTCPQGNN